MPKKTHVTNNVVAFEPARIIGSKNEFRSRTTHRNDVFMSDAGDVVSTINDTASQTNPLAPNTTIESAGAGEASKGFAVVAGEVKALASQISHATKKVAWQTEDIKVAIERAVTSVANNASGNSEVGEYLTSMFAAAERKRAATTEIARNIEQLAAEIAEATHSITSLTEPAHQMSSVSVGIQRRLEVLNEQSRHFGREVTDFLEEIVKVIRAVFPPGSTGARMS